jgi:hypothetical protein
MIVRWKARCFPLALADFTEAVDTPDGATFRLLEGA